MEPTTYPGFITEVETREAVCDIVAPREGAEPFRVTLQTGLTFRQLEAIPLEDETLWSDLRDAIWRYVLDWNALWLNPESGEYERLLPPAQVGPDQFKAINNNLVRWIGLELKIGHLRDRNLPKGVTPSSDTPAPSPEGSTDSPPPKARSRKSLPITTS
jgi:hypothetical protein